MITQFYIASVGDFQHLQLHAIVVWDPHIALYQCPVLGCASLDIVWTRDK